ncbi:MAG: hypothetical protein R3330_15405, partial [Saprospiraceae bacterium]|nr:hypothetical protein [Saprospiraceae bacterium]
MSKKDTDTEVAPRPNEQPQASGNSGAGVTVPKRQDLPPADSTEDVETLKEQMAAMQARIEQMESERKGTGS